MDNDLIVILEGGFNTGRLYTAEGQRVYWWQFCDKSVYFKDISRMVDGYLDPLDLWLDRLPAHIVAERLMRRYDRGEHRRWREDRREPHKWVAIPAGFDFGPSLDL